MSAYRDVENVLEKSKKPKGTWAESMGVDFFCIAIEGGNCVSISASVDMDCERIHSPSMSRSYCDTRVRISLMRVRDNLFCRH